MRQISIPPSVVFKNVGDELVLLDFDRGVYYGLNEVGASVWQAISSGRTLAETIDLLLGEYDVDRAQLESDVETLLSELRGHGLIVVEEER